MEKNLQVYLTINGVDKYSQILKEATDATKHFTDIHNKNSDSRKNKTKQEGQSLDSLSNNYGKVSKSIKNRILGAGAALITIGAAKRAFSDFANQDKYIKKTQGLLHTTNGEMENYSENIKNIAKNSLNSINDLLEVGFIGAKSGFKTKELSNFVKQIDLIQTAVSTSTSETPQAVAESFGIIAKSFNKQPITELADEFARLVDTTANLDIHEMSQALAKLNMVASSTGASFRAIAPAVASLVSVGMSGAKSSTQIFGIAKAFEKFGSKKVAKMLGLKEASLEGQGFVTLLNNINTRFGKMGEMQRNRILGKVFGADTAITIGQLIKQIDTINEKVEDLKNNSKDFAKEMSKTQKAGAFGTLKGIEANLSIAYSTVGKMIDNLGIPSLINLLLKILIGGLSAIERLTSKPKQILSSFKNAANISTDLLKPIINDIFNKKDKYTPRETSEKNLQNTAENFKKLFEPIQIANKNLIENPLANEVNIVLTNKSSTALKAETVEAKKTLQTPLVKQNILNR